MISVVVRALAKQCLDVFSAEMSDGKFNSLDSRDGRKVSACVTLCHDDVILKMFGEISGAH